MKGWGMGSWRSAAPQLAHFAGSQVALSPTYQLATLMHCRRRWARQQMMGKSGAAAGCTREADAASAHKARHAATHVVNVSIRAHLLEAVGVAACDGLRGAWVCGWGPAEARVVRLCATCSTPAPLSPAGAPSITGWFLNRVYTVRPVQQGIQSVEVSADLRSACRRGAEAGPAAVGPCRQAGARRLGMHLPAPHILEHANMRPCR